MISIVTYGRNDNYSFNLVKRTAFSFNCLAEVLTEEDEILFVDYNTPDHLPTLPEFIWDTLTDKALGLLRVIRISRDLHEVLKGDSPLPVLENVSRNAAIVRSNPKNHWILSTNPDVLLVLSSKWRNLDELLRSIPDSFYEMPRLDIPESIWSSLHRGDPKTNMTILRDWLVSNKAAIVETVPDWRFQKYLLFDAPGDFQLAPRDFFFRLRGFDQSMNKYLHSDSNLAKRMWLLNRCRTDHLLGSLWVLHQDHYLSGEWAKTFVDMVHNDLMKNVARQNTIKANDEKWGLQDVQLPNFSLSARLSERRTCFSQLSTPVNGELPLSREPDWQMQSVYRLCHYHPEVLTLYLRESLQVTPPDSLLVYVGQNSNTLESVRRVWEDVSPTGVPVCDLCEYAERGESLIPDILLVDFYYERSEYWEKRIRLVHEQMQRQLHSGYISEHEATEEASRFADVVDTQEWQSQLVSRWEKLLPYVQLHSGTLIILLGGNLYHNPYAKLKEALAEYCLGVKVSPTMRPKLARTYATSSVCLTPEGKPLPRIFRKVRKLRRRIFGSPAGQEDLMTITSLECALRERFHLAGPPELLPLYVHHRLVVLRLK